MEKQNPYQRWPGCFLVGYYPEWYRQSQPGESLRYLQNQIPFRGPNYSDLQCEAALTWTAHASCLESSGSHCILSLSALAPRTNPGSP